VIEVKNVTKKYGSFVAVDDISFTINDGEIVGFLGPNGAGKSTTMNIITGYIEQTEGSVIVNGFDTIKKPKKAKQQIGYMPEGVPLYTDLTVKEFVTYMAELRKVDRKNKKEKVQEVLKETGLDTMQNKLIKNLSRGQKQRVSLAGTLVGNPKILILDEPTVGLDPKQITEIRSLIKNLGKNHTVILSSHILSEVSQICDKVIIINKGKLVATDTPENLERKVSNNNVLFVTVEDNENKLDSIKDNIKGVKSIKLIKTHQDNTKQYEITGEEDVNLNKIIFSEFAKEGITIFEMKKPEATLEDAFMKIIKEGGDK
jgi:ABC-2 type transport system ATP-binding protein